MSEAAAPALNILFPDSGGELSKLLRAYDWTKSSLGPPEEWSTGLKAAVRMMLPSQAQIVLFWGEDYAALYNDAYAPTIGLKHPAALGKPASEYWTELWEDLEPLLRNVRETGETLHAKSRPFYIERFGFPETVYFDISYSAVLEDDGSVGGVFCVVAETTSEVRAKAELRAQQARLAELFRQAPGFMCVLAGPEHRFELVNDSYRALIGGRDVLGLTLAEALPEVVEQGFLGLLDEVYRSGKPHIGSATPVNLLQPDGTIANLFLDFVYQPITDEHGRVTGVFVEGMDVTERSAAIERQKLLLNELNHRVKNSLATAQSIVMQSLRSSSSLDVAKEVVQERIVSLASAHDLLTRESWSGALLSEVVGRATRPFAAGGRIHCGGDTVRVSPDQALALSLAFHELSTNASKYGALSNPAGRVDVAWSVDHDLGRIILSWRESGGPPVEPPTRKGFGSRLIERGLRDQLGGEVKVAYDPTGLRYDIVVPLAEDAPCGVASLLGALARP